jgi:hypothetical protein
MISLRSIKHVILQPIDNSSNQCVGDKAAPNSLSVLYDQLQHHKGYEVHDVAADDPRIPLRGLTKRRRRWSLCYPPDYVREARVI